MPFTEFNFIWKEDLEFWSSQMFCSQKSTKACFNTYHFVNIFIWSNICIFEYKLYLFQIQGKIFTRMVDKLQTNKPIFLYEMKLQKK